jgi:hypothetical protein
MTLSWPAALASYDYASINRCTVARWGNTPPAMPDHVLATLLESISFGDLSRLLSLDQQGYISLLPKCGDERLAALGSPELGACMDSQFGEVHGTEIGQLVILPMRPEVFDWIQLGRIRW